jgi:hypothetical protein
MKENTDVLHTSQDGDFAFSVLTCISTSLRACIRSNFGGNSAGADAPCACTQQRHQAVERGHSAGKVIAPERQQPKRILGLMPNYRAVSAGAIPPPHAWTSVQNRHSERLRLLGFCVHRLHFWNRRSGSCAQAARDRSLGVLGILLARVAITPNYNGLNSFNASELLGRGIAQAISTRYYPSQDRTVAEIATKWGYAIYARRGHQHLPRVLARYGGACSAPPSVAESRPAVTGPP